ncbi:MAG TPA: TolC family protein [Telluria sp.]|nr:TolC family protein [Telluria sp.]
MRMMLCSLLIAGTAVASPSPPAQFGIAPAAAQAILARDPEVLAASAGLNAARQDGKSLQQSPYEWTARASAQRRNSEPGARSNEWNAGLERTLRLPAKGSADRQLASATVDQGLARYQIAWRTAALALIDAWLEWHAAQEQRALASAHVKAARENVAAVEKRVRAGDASRLDVSLAQAELAEQRRLENTAKTAATVALARLRARFPGVPEQSVPMPAPAPFLLSSEALRERIVAASPQLQEAQAQLRKASAQNERARAERIPDPTIGVYTGSEARGQERITGISLSIPIPGSQRGARANAASFSEEMTRHELDLKKRQLEADVAAMIATAEGDYEGWQIAESGAADMRGNAVLTQRAYVLGEVDLQAMLSANRLATTAEQTALTAKAGAARAYYALLLDARLLWDSGTAGPGPDPFAQ